MSSRTLHKFPRPKTRLRLRRRMRTAVAFFGLALGAVSPLHAQTMRKVSLDASQSARESASAIDARWRESLEGFAAIDKEHAPRARRHRLRRQLVDPALGRSRARVRYRPASSSAASAARACRTSRATWRSWCCRTSRAWSWSMPATTTSPKARRPNAVLASYADFVRPGPRGAAEHAHRLPVDQAQPVARGAYAGAIQANELIEQYSKSDPDARLHRRLHEDARRQGRPRADLFLGRLAPPQRRRLRDLEIGDRRASALSREARARRGRREGGTQRAARRSMRWLSSATA